MRSPPSTRRSRSWPPRASATRAWTCGSGPPRACPSESCVAAARERTPGVDVRLAPAEDLPFGDGEFDASLAQLVVHFMADPVAGLREMGRVTAPGGAVAACV